MSPFSSLFAVLVVAVSAVAAPVQSPTKALRAQSKAEVAAVKKAAKVMLDDAREELAAALDGYAAGSSGSFEVMVATVDAVGRHRVAFEDALIASCEALSSEGQAILESLFTGDDPTSPSDLFAFDFMAGGGGTWDRHVLRLDAQLERFEARLGKLLAKHVAQLEELAGDLGGALAVTMRLPELGAGHTNVDPPLLPVTSATVAEPARLVALARFMDDEGADAVVLGVHAPSSVYGTRITASGGESFSVSEIFAVSATTTFTIPIGDFFAVETNTVSVEVDQDGAVASHAQAIESPALDAPKNPALTKVVTKESRRAIREVRKRSSIAAKLLRQQLSSAKSAMNTGSASPDEALALGFGALATARNTYAFGREVDLADFVSRVSDVLTDVGVSSPQEFPDDLRLNARGRYARAAAVVRRLDVRAQARFTQLFGRFRAKLQKQAAKVDDTFFVTAVLGRTIPLDPPVLAPPGTGALSAPHVRPHVTDVVIANWLVDEELRFEFHVAGAADPQGPDEFDVALIDVLDEETSGTVAADTGGVGWFTVEPATPSSVFAVVAGPSASTRRKWLTINPPLAGLD